MNVRKIALEEHFFAPIALEYAKESAQLRGFATPRTIASLPKDFLELAMDVGERRLELMDKNGIDFMVLSQSHGDGHLADDISRIVDVSRQINDFLAERVAAHPDRFAGFAFVPIEDADEAAKELERTVTQYGFKGVMIHGHVKGHFLDEPQFAPFWEAVETLGVPVYLHPALPYKSNTGTYDGHPGLMTATWQSHADVAFHTMRLISGGVFDDYPKAQLIIGHMGESIPYSLHRLDEGWEPTPRNPEPPHRKLRQRMPEYFQTNIVITTSGNFSHEALQCAISAIGADRILFSIDTPYQLAHELVDFIDTAPLSSDQREKICHLNAERVLKIAPRC